MTESSEIDNLRKNVDDAKMKLATEIKVLYQTDMPWLILLLLSALYLFIFFCLVEKASCRRTTIPESRTDAKESSVLKKTQNTHLCA